MNDIILVSGGFDPIHSGHVDLIEDASNYGDVVVLLNSDAWLIQKKGREFLPYKEREIIMNALKNVIDVIAFDDSDKTCIDGIRKAIKKYPDQKIKFANGGDRKDNSTPKSETTYCKQSNVEILWEVGGEKTNSSSWILKKWRQK